MSLRGRPLGVFLDVCCFLVFAIAGRQSHGEGEALRSIVIVAAPFVVAWLIVAFFSGVYRSSSLRRVALAWLVADLAQGGAGSPLGTPLFRRLTLGDLPAAVPARRQSRHASHSR